MRLMESMRAGTDSTFIQVILAVVLVSFIGLGGRNRGATVDVVATVNGDPISSLELGRAFRLAERYREMTSKEPITDDERKALQEQVTQDLIAQRALLQEAKAMGVEVSDMEIAAELLTRPYVKDKDGNFSPETYENFLRSQRTTRAVFEEELREQLILQKLSDLIRLGASVPDAAVRQTYVDKNTKVKLEYVRVRSSAFLATVTPSEDEINTYLNDNADGVKARYEKDFERLYNQGEKVELSVIRLAVRDDGVTAADLEQRLAAIKAEAEGGADFAALATKWSEDPSAQAGGKMATVDVKSLDPDVAAALSSLKDSEISKPVVGTKDVRLFKLLARTPAKVIALADAQKDIATALLKETAAPKAARTFAEGTLLAKWTAEGAVPEADLATYNLRVQTSDSVPLSSEGNMAFRPPPELMKAAGSAQPGTVLAEVYQQDDVLWVAKLIERTDADLAAFDTEKDRYREIALEERRRAFFESWRASVVAKAKVSR
jgi:peptidyl-prolyl cis-trans isomerase D